jgi:hypothetical protein
VPGQFTISLTKGLNMISLPLRPAVPYTARSLAAELGATIVVMLNSESGRFVGFTPDHDGDGFPIEGGSGYIVNVTSAVDITFDGTMWNNAPGAMPLASNGAWAFVATGRVRDSNHELASSGEYMAIVRNLRTGASVSDMVGLSGDGRFTVAWADLSRRNVVEVGDRLEITIRDATGRTVSGPTIHEVTAEDIGQAFAATIMELGNLVPEISVLAQNYPNPFNPETWIPYQLAEDAYVSIRIYSMSGRLIRVLDLSHKSAGTYVSRGKAGYWDGRDSNGELVASGVYIYAMQAGDFTAVRKMVILK